MSPWAYAALAIVVVVVGYLAWQRWRWRSQTCPPGTIAHHRNPSTGELVCAPLNDPTLRASLMHPVELA